MNYITGLIGIWDWDVFSVISNTILVTALVIVNLWYFNQMKKQTKFMETDRYIREMENLVAPLHYNEGNTYIFTKKNFSYQDRMGEGVKENLLFWENIKQYKYLGSAELRSAIDNYIKSKSDQIGDESYAKAETELFEATRNRYSELENVIGNFGEKLRLIDK